VEEAGGFWEARGLTRHDLDLTDAGAVVALFQEERPTVVIHCAAMSRTTACQQQPQWARRVNVEATSLLARLCEGVPFLFFSTDLVFDGRKGLYTEADAPCPISVYGETKTEAERLVLQNPRHLVIRTSLTAGRSPTGDRSVDEELCRAWREGRTVRLFTDEYRCPMAVEAKARAAWELVSGKATGLFHVAGADRLSRWEIGQIVAGHHGDLNPKLEPSSIRDSAAGPRPADTSLDCTKARGRLSFELPGLRNWRPG
jgi:dTDP-4-dehydrorhamnose reductase